MPCLLSAMPATPLRPATPLGARLAALGVGDLRAAARWVAALPYGRNADRADYRLVLAERRGTCSTKHALVAACAAEVGAPVELRWGVFAMREATTPGVGAVLAAAGLAAVPEMHCWLAVGGRELDLTWPGRVTPPPPMLWSEATQPDRIGAPKVARHRDAVAEWAAARGLKADAVWEAREACIAALGTAQGTRGCPAKSPG